MLNIGNEIWRRSRMAVSKLTLCEFSQNTKGCFRVGFQLFHNSVFISKRQGDKPVNTSRSFHLNQILTSLTIVKIFVSKTTVSFECSGHVLNLRTTFVVPGKTLLSHFTQYSIPRSMKTSKKFGFLKFWKGMEIEHWLKWDKKSHY